MENSVIEIVSQLNEASELIKDSKEKVQLAQLNLKAGIKAKTSIAYQSALEYLTTGLKLLPNNSWDTYYELTFEITKETSECAYLCGKFDMAEEKSQILLQQARSSLEKAEIIRMQLVHYTVLDKLEDAIHIGIKGLRLLGIRLPYKPNPISIIRELLLTKWNLRNKKIADLVDQPELTDSTKQLIMNILMEMSPLAYMINNENLVALIILKQVNISLKYGNTPSSAYAYGTYGAMILGEVLGDLKSRYEFGKLSLKLNERFNDQKLKGRILFIYTLFIHHWNHPWKTVVPYFQEIIDDSYQAGDIYYLVFSCVNAIRWNPEMNLKTFYHRQINEYLPIIEASKHQDALDFNKVSLQMAANLLGMTENHFSLSDKNFDENECLERMKQKQNISGVAKYYLYKLQIHYFYEDYINAVELISITESRIKSLLAIQWTVEFCLYSFLSYTAIFHKMSFLKKQNTMRFLRKRYNQMKKWSDYNPSNYLHFTLLMKAELARLKNKFRKAFTFYDLSIKHAKANGFIRYEALANELSAKFHLGFGQEKLAAFYMKEAVSCYSRWGAVEKIRHLNKKYHTLSASGPETDKFSEQPDNETNISQSTAKIKSETLDLDTIIKTLQSISGEINLEKLLSGLIKYVLENSGAQKAFLILENAGQFTIEAEGNIEKEGIKVLESIPLPLRNMKEIDQFNVLNKQIEKKHILPLSILQYTIRTKNHIVLQDACNENLYKNDPYIIANRTKSVISVPIISKGKFIGLLYLENNLTTSAFTDKRLKILKILASQAAISIENAHLYQTAQNEITERKQTELALRESEKRFRNSILNAPYPIMIHAEGDVIELSNIWTKMTGYILDDIPSIERWIELAYGKDAVPSKEFINKRYDLKEFQYDGEWEIIIKDGSTRIWDFSTSPIGRLSDGRRAVITIGVDITKRKQAEEELEKYREHLGELVEKRTAELKEKTDKIEDSRKALTYLVEDVNKAREDLERANRDIGAVNRELQDFAYIVSHDLKAPLRAVSQLAYWISHDYAEVLDEDGKEHLNLLSGRVKRMDALINGILQYSRLGRAKEKLDKIDLDKTLPSIIETLAPPENIRITLKDELPEIVGNRTHMEQVFQNLIGNAIKFMDKPEGLITIGCRDEGSHWEFRITDNGPGIEEKYHERIFKIFQTLVPRDEHESTGIGLTLVKKTIEQYDGKVWVESEVGKGSSFVFTLPKK